MKHVTLALLFGLTLAIGGCGGTSGTGNVGEDADAKAMADYEAQMAADQKARDDAEKSGN